jgi:hypothetical protein
VELRPCIVQDCAEFVIPPALFCGPICDAWGHQVSAGCWGMVGEGAQLAIFDASPELRLDLAKAAADRITSVERKRLRKRAARGKRGR